MIDDVLKLIERQQFRVTEVAENTENGEKGLETDEIEQLEQKQKDFEMGILNMSLSNA